jgi:hypothetical protein
VRPCVAFDFYSEVVPIWILFRHPDASLSFRAPDPWNIRTKKRAALGMVSDPRDRHAADVLKPVLDRKDKQPAPSDQDSVAAIQSAAERLSAAAADSKGPGADAARQILARPLPEIPYCAPSRCIGVVQTWV